MAQAKQPIPVDEVEVAIVGGGMCGVICAGRCADKGISYKIIERQYTLGGVWLNLANQHSALQVKRQIALNWLHGDLK
jgi:cation diffusion facilitator CzcD-associated flavoprotein CzcO